MGEKKQDQVRYLVVGALLSAAFAFVLVVTGALRSSPERPANTDSVRLASPEDVLARTRAHERRAEERAEREERYRRIRERARAQPRPPRPPESETPASAPTPPPAADAAPEPTPSAPAAPPVEPQPQPSAPAGGFDPRAY